MGYATSVMISTSLGIGAIDLSSIFWRAWRWKLGREEVMEDEDVLEVHVEDLECALAEGELLGISLHALAGAPSPQTMRIIGKIGAQVVVILVDTGSNHSFVDPYVANNIQLPAHEESRLTVVAVNGATLPCCKTSLF